MSSIFPSEKEIEHIENVKKKIASSIRECITGIDYDLKFAGSTELGTFVSGEHDVDVFIISKDKDRAFDMVSKCISGARKKGELDIWHTSVDGVEVDIVFIDPRHPKTQTLLHTEHYKKVLTGDMKREIIKAKALMKNRGCYSAELGGITGIALTELIVKYGSLEKACEALERDKGLILQDPTNPKRNLLASVTPTKWECIKKACREYRETGKLPTEKYTEETFKKEMKEKGFSILELPRQDDVAVDYSRVMSICNACGNELVNLEKDVEKPECNAYVKSKTIIAFKAPEKLSEEKEVRISRNLPEEVLEAFKKVHPDAKVEGEYLVAKVKRKITEPKKWLEQCITDKYIIA